MRFQIILALASGLALAAGCRSQPEDTLHSGVINYSITPTQKVASSPKLLELGKATYLKHCAPCHGAQGDSQGKAAYLLYPKPRDFTSGQYRLVSTWEGIATDEDLFGTISRGMPGSAMPSWAHLPEETRWGLIHYIKKFSRVPLLVGPAGDPKRLYGEGTGIVRVPLEPSYDAAAQARARELFLKGCAPCHGNTGRGDGQQEQRDAKGFPTRPRDLTAGIYKGSPDPDHVYRRLVAGLPGSPMPQNPYLHGLDGWHLTHFVRNLSSDQQRAKVEMRTFRMVARRVRELPTHPDSGIWKSTEAVNLHLMPLWWRSERPEELTVKALHDGNQIAFLLSWSDASHDDTAMRPQDFRDAAAIEFALTPDPPFFAMGHKGARVNIWMWKSERETDKEAFQDLEKVYPNIGIDSYPNLQRSPLEQPMRNALTLNSDPTFVTAWGAGNIVADPTRKSSAEDLRAEGFGTLTARPITDRAVEATGVFSTGSYRVVFRRPFNTGGQNSVTFQAGHRVSVAFAVWNGSAGDRDGKKSVTIWQEFVVAP